MLKQTKNRADVRTTDRTRTSYTFQMTNRCGCDLCSAAIISRATTGTVGSRKFQLPLWIASCSVHGSPRPAVTLTLTWPRTFIMLHFATHTHDVPAFSSPAFSTPAIWSHVFQSCVFQSRVFSVPTGGSVFSRQPSSARDYWATSGGRDSDDTRRRYISVFVGRSDQPERDFTDRQQAWS